MAIVWQREQRMICRGCGHHREESFDPKTQGKWLARPLRCFACQSIEDSAKNFAKGGSTAGLQFRTEVSDA